MPPTIGYSFGDIVLVLFPFTHQTGLKKRPAVVVSSQAYHQRRRDLLVMAVTSHVRPSAEFGELVIREWKKAGLMKASVTKPIVTTIETALVLRKLGRLQEVDKSALRDILRLIVG